MYSVYLVDDEPWALKLIENGFPWAKYDFNIQGKSRTVEEAAAYILHHHPDVVFTDIRIAGESGIDLIRCMREELLDTTFVVLTGYAEFPIAQAAIKLDVFDFLLKPIDLEETDALLKRLQIHEQQKAKQRKQAILDKLESMTISEYLQQQDIAIPSTVIRAITIRNIAFEEIAQLPLPAQNILYTDTRQVTCIFGQQPGFETDILKWLPSFCCNGSVGVSEPASGNEPILTPLLHAEMISFQSFLTGKNDVFFYAGHHYKKILQLAETLLSGTLSFNGEQLYRLWVNEAYHLDDLSQLVCCLSQASAVKPVSHYQELLGTYQNAQEMAEQLLIQLSMAQAASQQDDKNLICEQLVHLVQERYTQDISLSQLAKKLNISSSYLSEIFSRYKGVPFSKYLNQLRNARACELLRGTQLSVQEIAALSGFNDYFYFSKQFKKAYGLTPMQFRTQKNPT